MAHTNLFHPNYSIGFVRYKCGRFGYVTSHNKLNHDLQNVLVFISQKSSF
ncbi:hypothetical protein Hdeb2414_s0015g00448301 [Helianthus debilis subsp. tardiflorus]